MVLKFYQSNKIGFIMLYLIRVYGPVGRNQSILKIGFSDDIEKKVISIFLF